MGQQDWEPGIVTRFSKDLFERINCSNNPDVIMQIIAITTNGDMCVFWTLL